MKVALVAVQLAIGPEVLASPEAYRAHLIAAGRDALANVAAEARLVVFPELAGHLALYALAPAAARRQTTLAGALNAAAVRRPLEVLRGIASTRTLAPKHAVLAALAPDGERFWRAVFGPLARELGAYVVAGSHLRLGASGDLTNASLAFSPDGRVVATTDKVNLVPGVEDGAPGALGLARGTGPIPVVATPFGALCTLIGYDAFAAPRTSLERFVPLGPDLDVAIVANPAVYRGDGDGLPATLAQTRRARFGVTAHLVGRVLDLAFDGRSEILERTGAEVAVLARADRGGHVAAVATV